MLSYLLGDPECAERSLQSWSVELCACPFLSSDTVPGDKTQEALPKATAAGLPGLACPAHSLCTGAWSSSAAAAADVTAAIVLLKCLLLESGGYKNA